MRQEHPSNSRFEDSLSENHAEFDLLQSLLVEPETEKLRDRLERVEHDIRVLKRDATALAAFKEYLAPHLENLIHQKIDAFKQELIETIQPVLEEMIDDRIEPTKIISVQVKGISPER